MEIDTNKIYSLEELKKLGKVYTWDEDFFLRTENKIYPVCKLYQKIEGEYVHNNRYQIFNN